VSHHPATRSQLITLGLAGACHYIYIHPRRRSVGRPRSAPVGQRAPDPTRAKTRFPQTRLESGHRLEEGYPAEGRMTLVRYHAQVW
jgi:hypothetical protein